MSGSWPAPIAAAEESPTTPGVEAALIADIIELARQYGRYGYRRITALLRSSRLDGEQETC